MPKALRLEVFAELSARISAGEPRAEALAALSVDEAQFEASQEFWLARMSDEASRGRDAIIRRYGELFALVRKKLAEPKKPARREWRVSAPGKVAISVPPVPPMVREGASGARGGRALPGSAASSPSPAATTSAPVAPYAARLTLEQLAALRAEFVMAKTEAEHGAVLARFGLDAEGWEREEAHWQGQLAGDEGLFRRYLRQFQYCKALLQPRR